MTNLTNKINNRNFFSIIQPFYTQYNQKLSLMSIGYRRIFFIFAKYKEW